MRDCCPPAKADMVRPFQNVMTTSLITGGAGFIGSHLVEACLERGHRVLILDNLSSGKMDYLPTGITGLTFIRGDITDSKTVYSIAGDNPDIDYVFHLAALVSVPQAMADPVRAHAINFDASLQLMEAFRSTALKKFVFASSSAVYGEARTVPTPEDAPTLPISTYGADKLMTEHYLRIYSEAFGLPFAACRLFNVFGERQDPSSPYSGVISIFFDTAMAWQAGKRWPLVIYGDGRQTRDFIYVKDVANALVFLAERPDLRQQIFNLGYGKQTEILELVGKIKRLVGADCRVELQGPRVGDIRNSAADISKFLETRFKFSFGLDGGLQQLKSFLER